MAWKRRKAFPSRTILSRLLMIAARSSAKARSISPSQRILSSMPMKILSRMTNNEPEAGHP